MEGFIIDAPRAVILGKKNTYATITASSGQIQFSGATLDINGGWSPYALISIPTTTTLTVSLTDAQLTDGYFEAALGAEKTSAENEQMFFDATYDVDEEDYTIVIDKAVTAGSVRINGLKEVSGTPSIGQFAVAISTGSTTITFNSDMAGERVTPVYSVKKTAENYVVTRDSIPTKGRCILQFPVYTNNEDDATIAAYCQVTLFSAGVTQEGTLGGQFKNASTFGLSIKGTDPNRSDKKIWEVAFFDAE